MFETPNRNAPSFRTAPVFLPPLYKSFAFKTLNATFPFPQVFSLSPFPLAREPTVTAWRGTTLGRDITNAISLIMPLRFVRRLRNNMAQPLVLYVKSDARYGRRLAAPTGKTVGTRIDKYRTLIMPLVRKCKEQHALLTCTSHTRAPARQKQANLCVSKKDESAVFGVWEKETQRPKCKRLQLVVIVAKRACV